MRSFPFAFRVVAATLLGAGLLSGCMQDPASRGLGGAAVGMGVASATHGNLATGAIIGGLAGVASCAYQIGGRCYR